LNGQHENKTETKGQTMNTNETNNSSNPSVSSVPSFPSFPPVPSVPSFPPVPSVPSYPGFPSNPGTPDAASNPSVASNPPEAGNPEAGGLVPPSGRATLAIWLKIGLNRWPDWVERGGPNAFEAWVSETAAALRLFFAPPAPGKPRYLAATMDHLRKDGRGDIYRVRLFVSKDHEVCNVSRLVGLACGLRVGCTESELRLKDNGALLATIEERLLVVLYGPDGPIDWPNRGVRVVAV
jgi:hypothetical protein